MNKILVGLIVGAVLGLIDGATAWFTPAVRDQMLGIIIGSTMKGIIAGIAAGWYARRVQSVPKGIIFGFTVGLLLAFAVAAMPSATGEHYWWQIMVPGSILGGVIGWATQRYGRPGNAARGAYAAAAMFAMLLTSVSAFGDQDHQVQAAASTLADENPAFEKLKALAGTWTANQMTADGPTTSVVYRVTGDGSVIIETMFAGEPHEMVTVYTADGGNIVATHYCASGNQPVFKYNPSKSNDRQLVFDFVSVTGKKTGYINGLTINFSEDGKTEEVWGHSTGSAVKLYLASRK
jgi:hypothetical protein